MRGTEWVKTLSNRNDVAWNQVQDAYTSWSHTEKHLNPVVGAVIAIAVAVVTSGAGLAAFAGNALLSNVGSELHAEGAKLIGDYAKELGSVGKLLSHTTLAAMTAEIGRGNGKGAAAGALAIEIAGASLGNNLTAKHAYAETVSKFSKVIGALAGGIATGSASGVNSGASAAEIVDTFNRQFHQNELDELQKLSANDDDKLERLIAAACRKVHCLAQGVSDPAEEAYLNALLKQYPNTAEEDKLLNNATIMLPWRENLNGSYPAALPPSELNLFTYTHFDQSADTHQNIMYLWAKNYSEVMGTSLQNGYRAAMVMAVFPTVLGSKTSQLGRTVLGKLNAGKLVVLNKPLGLGSTGRNIPANLNEKLALEQAISNPNAGRQLPVPMTDKRWPSSDGWVKMSQNINGIEIHYVKNTKTGAIDDFKFK